MAKLTLVGDGSVAPEVYDALAAAAEAHGGIGPFACGGWMDSGALLPAPFSLLGFAECLDGGLPCTSRAGRIERALRRALGGAGPLTRREFRDVSDRAVIVVQGRLIPDGLGYERVPFAEVAAELGLGRRRGS